LPDLLAIAAETHPERPAVVFEGVAMSYSELDAAASGFAASLAALGVSSGDRVGLWSANSPDAVIALWGIPRAECTAVPLNTRLPAVQAQGLCRLATVELVLTDDPSIQLGTRTADLATLPSGPPLADAQPDGQAPLIVFTSGSRGGPKGVLLTSSNLEASAKASGLHIGNDENDRWLVALPLFHVGAIAVLWRAAMTGGAVALERSFDPGRVGEMLGPEATVASLVPTMLRRLLDAYPGRFDGVRAVLVGGGPVDMELLARAVTTGLPAVATYGMTEMASQIATQPLGSEPESGLRLLQGVELRIGATQQIEVKGPMLSPGYVGEATRDPNDWFSTGDRGVLDDDGALSMLGRADDVILSGGENVDPEVVEQALIGHPAVKDAGVFGVPDEEWGRLVVAAVVRGDQEVSAEELEDFSRERLAGFQIPRRWMFVPELPRDQLGKLQRDSLGSNVL